MSEDTTFLPDNTVEHLSRSLGTGQLAIIYAMIEQNAKHEHDQCQQFGVEDSEAQACHAQRLQLIWRQMIEIDALCEGVAGERVLNMRLDAARKFVEKHEELW